MRKPLYSTLITVLLVLFILFKVCYKNILQLKKGKKHQECPFKNRFEVKDRLILLAWGKPPPAPKEVHECACSRSVGGRGDPEAHGRSLSCTFSAVTGSQSYSCPGKQKTRQLFSSRILVFTSALRSTIRPALQKEPESMSQPVLSGTRALQVNHQSFSSHQASGDSKGGEGPAEGNSCWRRSDTVLWYLLFLFSTALTPALKEGDASLLCRHVLCSDF